MEDDSDSEDDTVVSSKISNNKALLYGFIQKQEDDKAIPSYTIKKHTLDQSQICEINEESFILNQYVEDHHYQMKNYSSSKILVEDLLNSDEIMERIKLEDADTIAEDIISKVENAHSEANLEDKNALTENESMNGTESAVEDTGNEDAMSLSSMNVRKLLKKNISSIIKSKNLSNYLIKKKSSTESFESNSDNNSEVSVSSDKRDSRGSTSYVFSMFMQSANNLIKKKRNSGSFEDLKISISGPYQDDEVKTPTKLNDAVSEVSSVDDIGSVTSNKTIVLPLNSTIEFPKRISSVLPPNDEKSLDIFKPSKSALNSPMKLEMSSNIQSTPIKLINKSVERNKHTSADSAIYLGDSITYDNIKDIINEEWKETINKQRFSIIEEGEGDSMNYSTFSLSSSSTLSSSKSICNNQILRDLSISRESITSSTEMDEEITETKSLIEKHLKKINNIICEIASTEKTYVHELSKLLEIYYVPMEQDQLLNNTEMNYLYSNIINIYQFHSEIFYPKLELVQKEHEKNIKLISSGDEVLRSESNIKLINESISIEAFFKIVLWPFQILYKPYYINFKKASDFVSIFNSLQKQKYGSKDILVQAEELGFATDCPIFERDNKKKFKKLKTYFKTATERMDHNQVDILGYLILPIQRLPRYLLLLEGLAKSVKALEEETAKLIPKQQPIPEPITKPVMAKSEIKKFEDQSKITETVAENKNNGKTESSIEVKKPIEGTDRNRKSQFNVKSMVAQFENNDINSGRSTPSKIGTSPRINSRNGVRPKTNVTSKTNSNSSKLNTSKTTTTTKSSSLKTSDSRSKISAKTNTTTTSTASKRAGTPSMNRINTKLTKKPSVTTSSLSSPSPSSPTPSSSSSSTSTTPTPSSTKENMSSITTTTTQSTINNTSLLKEEMKNKNENNITTIFNTQLNDVSSIQRNYTIAMAAEDIKNIIELCNKAISS